MPTPLAPALLAAAALAAPPPFERATFASLSCLLVFPTAASLSTEARWGRFALSGSGFGGATPDLTFFGGWGMVGAGAAAHGIFGGGPTRFELAGGLDVALLVDLDRTYGWGTRVSPAPTLFLGARVLPRRRPGALVRVGVELSLHSIAGLTVSVGRTRPGTGRGARP